MRTPVALRPKADIDYNLPTPVLAAFSKSPGKAWQQAD